MTEKTVSIFVCAAMPRRVRVTEIHFHSGSSRQFLMSSKFFSVVNGEAFLQLVWNSWKCFNCCFVKCIILSVVKPKSNKVSEFTFNMSSKTAGFALSKNCVAFPMTEASTVFSSGRTFAYWSSVWDFTSFVLSFALLMLAFEPHNFLAEAAKHLCLLHGKSWGKRRWTALCQVSPARQSVRATILTSSLQEHTLGRLRYSCQGRNGYMYSYR